MTTRAVVFPSSWQQRPRLTRHEIGPGTDGLQVQGAERQLWFALPRPHRLYWPHRSQQCERDWQCCLLGVEELKPFPGNIGGNIGRSRNIATRLSET